MSAIKDANGIVTKASYNGIGQRTGVNDPNQGSWGFAYNALGEVLAQTDARGITTQLTYDPLGRPQLRTATVDATGDGMADTVADSWAYDMRGIKAAGYKRDGYIIDRDQIIRVNSRGDWFMLDIFENVLGEKP